MKKVETPPPGDSQPVKSNDGSDGSRLDWQPAYRGGLDESGNLGPAMRDPRVAAREAAERTRVETTESILLAARERQAQGAAREDEMQDPPRSRAYWKVVNSRRSDEARRLEAHTKALERLADLMPSKTDKPANPTRKSKTKRRHDKDAKEFGLVAALRTKWDSEGPIQSITAAAKTLGLDNRTEFYRYPRLVEHFKKLRESERTARLGQTSVRAKSGRITPRK